MSLKYKRQQWSGVYYAKTDTHTFAVDRPGATWCLRIWDSSGKLIHRSGDHRTMALAKGAAQTFADKQEV